jgi:hypothetical protein
MNQHFCADRSRCLEATIIGTAPQYSTYVLIECPTPWAANASASLAIPPWLSAFYHGYNQYEFAGMGLDAAAIAI